MHKNSGVPYLPQLVYAITLWGESLSRRWRQVYIPAVTASSYLNSRSSSPTAERVYIPAPRLGMSLRSNRWKRSFRSCLKAASIGYPAASLGPTRFLNS